MKLKARLMIGMMVTAILITSCTSLEATNCYGAKFDEPLSLVYLHMGPKEEKINGLIAQFAQACGIHLQVDTAERFYNMVDLVLEDPPNLLIWPNDSPLVFFPEKLVDLHTIGAQTNYPDFIVKAGTVDGRWVAIPLMVDLQLTSEVWYSPKQFNIHGYAVPKTFDELNALVEKMVRDGNIPWSMGNLGWGYGWNGTNFIHDLLLSEHGAGYVKGIIDGTIPYNDTAVREAYQLFYRWASDPRYAFGGKEGTLGINGYDALGKVFSDPAQAMMIDASHLEMELYTQDHPSMVYGQDYASFQFPGSKTIMGVVDLQYYIMSFNDSPATRAFFAYLTGLSGAQAWAASGLDLGTNKLATGYYSDPRLVMRADIIARTDGYFNPNYYTYITREMDAIVAVIGGADIQTELDKVAAAQLEEPPVP